MSIETADTKYSKYAQLREFSSITNRAWVSAAVCLLSQVAIKDFIQITHQLRRSRSAKGQVNLYILSLVQIG